jgi:hypothetical protein
VIILVCYIFERDNFHTRPEPEMALSSRCTNHITARLAVVPLNLLSYPNSLVLIDHFRGSFLRPSSFQRLESKTPHCIRVIG